MAKRERTRSALLEAAIGLFAERDYDTVSTAEIARRAGVSEMTFFRHFPTKASLLVDDPYDPLIADAVRTQPPDLAALVAVAAGVRAAWQSIPAPESQRVRERLRIIAVTPSLRAAMMRNSISTEEAIADALVWRGNDQADARIVAAAAVAALNTALLDWATGTDTDLGITIDRALDMLEGRR